MVVFIIIIISNSFDLWTPLKLTIDQPYLGHLRNIHFLNKFNAILRIDYKSQRQVIITVNEYIESFSFQFNFAFDIGIIAMQEIISDSQELERALRQKCEKPTANHIRKNVNDPKSI